MGLRRVLFLIKRSLRAEGVYCEDCSNYRYIGGWPDNDKADECVAIVMYFNDYQTRNIPKRESGRPAELNSENDCHNYRRKFWKVWRKS